MSEPVNLKFISYEWHPDGDWTLKLEREDGTPFTATRDEYPFTLSPDDKPEGARQYMMISAEQPKERRLVEVKK